MLTAYNLASAVALALGAAIFQAVGSGHAGFASLFAISSLGRILTLPLLVRVSGGGRPREVMLLRTEALRPSIGAVQRPLLPASDAADEPGTGVSARSAARPGADVRRPGS